MKLKYSENFLDSSFDEAFQTYFQELGIIIDDWDSLFYRMQEEPDNFMYLIKENDKTIGFLIAKADKLTNWFFTETVGFIREFWVHPDYRGQRFGQELLEKVEKHFQEMGIHKCILTSDSAGRFYLDRGYELDSSYQAKNSDPVYLKYMKGEL